MQLWMQRTSRFTNSLSLASHSLAHFKWNIFLQLETTENMEIPIALACDALNFNSLHIHICAQSHFDRCTMHYAVCTALTCWSDKCFTGKIYYVCSKCMVNLNSIMNIEWVCGCLMHAKWKAGGKEGKLETTYYYKRIFIFIFPITFFIAHIDTYTPVYISDTMSRLVHVWRSQINFNV